MWGGDWSDFVLSFEQSAYSVLLSSILLFFLLFLKEFYSNSVDIKLQNINEKCSKVILYIWSWLIFRNPAINDFIFVTQYIFLTILQSFSVIYYFLILLNSKFFAFDITTQ